MYRVASVISGVCFLALVAMAQTELLPNPDFSLGETGWKLSAASMGSGGNATGAVTGGKYVVSVIAGGWAEYAIQLADTGLTILNGHTYQIHIELQSSMARPISYGVGMINSPWTTYSGTDKVTEMIAQLGTDSMAIDTFFTMASPDDMGGARIFLNFGKAAAWPSVSGGTISIMRISLKDMGGSAVHGNKISATAKQVSLSVNNRGFRVAGLSADASLKAYSLQGKLLEDLSMSARRGAEVSWSETGLKSGTYILRLVQSGKRVARTAIVTK